MQKESEGKMDADKFVSFVGALHELTCDAQGGILAPGNAPEVRAQLMASKSMLRYAAELVHLYEVNVGTCIGEDTGIIRRRSGVHDNVMAMCNALDAARNALRGDMWAADRCNVQHRRLSQFREHVNEAMSYIDWAHEESIRHEAQVAAKAWSINQKGA